MVQRLLSFGDGKISGATLNFRGVTSLEFYSYFAFARIIRLAAVQLLSLEHVSLETDGRLIIHRPALDCPNLSSLRQLDYRKCIPCQTSIEHHRTSTYMNMVTWFPKRKGNPRNTYLNCKKIHLLPCNLVNHHDS